MGKAVIDVGTSESDMLEEVAKPLSGLSPLVIKAVVVLVAP